MATVTQLTSASITSGTTLNVPNVSVESGDMLCLFVVCRESINDITNLNGIVLGYQMVSLNDEFGVSLRGVSRYGLQTSTVTNQTITITFNYSTAAAAIIFRVRPDAGNQLSLKQRIEQDGNLFTNTFTVGSIAGGVGSILLGSCATRFGYSFTDTDVTGGSWSSLFYKQTSAGINPAIFGQSKIMNASGTVTYGGTFSSGNDYPLGYLLEILETGIGYWGIRNL